MKDLNIFKDPQTHNPIIIHSTFLLYRLRFMVHNQHANYVLKNTIDEGFRLIFGQASGNIVLEAKKEFQELVNRYYGYSLKEML